MAAQHSEETGGRRSSKDPRGSALLLVDFIND